MACTRKHVLITGTSSGIGQAAMHAAVAAGYHVLAGNRSVPTDAPIGDDDAVSQVHLDVTRADDIARAVAAVAEHVGDRGLDGLVNVAGIGIPGPLEAMSMDDLRLSLDVDFFGQIALTQPLIPLVRKARGRIVFVGSIADRVTLPFFGALAAAKAAIASAAGTLRQELAPWGIRVVLVEPGFISTGADKATKERIDRLAAEFPPDAAALYGDMFATATDRGYKTQTSGTPPEGVADCIITALTTPRPRARYLTGGKARRVAATGLLPQKLQDALHRRAFGLPRPGSHGRG
jgi:NAD(P)-dependent dehydrogenase (short-subunit alcohol dehydrogenase family)